MSARRAASLAAAAAVLLLSACASNTGSSGQEEIRTASDRTAVEKRASIRLQLAISYYQDGKDEVALDEVKQAIAINPNSADAYGVRALIYTRMGEFALADDNYQRAIKLAPRNPELANNYGSFLCQNGRPALGMAQFETALKNPAYNSPINALLNAGSCSLRTRNHAEAERYLLDAMRVNPDFAPTNALLARVYFEKRDYTRAGFFINRLTTVAKLDSLPADQLWLAVRVNRKIGDRSMEASLVTQLHRRFPTSPELAAYQRGAFDE